MPKNSTTVLEFELDSLRTIREDEDFALAEIDLLHLGTNRNMCNISRECVEASKDSFYNKPIIYRYNNKLSPKLSTDFEEHSRDGDPTMNIAGHIPYGTSIEYVDRDGRTYVRVACIIHKVYLPTLMSILEKKDGTTKVSIEIVVLDGEQDSPSSVLNINKFRLRGVCLLGDDILEGIEGSQLNVVKFSKGQYNSYYRSVLKGKSSTNNRWSFTPQEKTFAGESIRIDKSKEALSDTSWGEVDKTELRNKVLSAANVKELVDAVYLLVESGWEDSPSTKLKYPVMEVKDGKAFYNRYALSSALGYAKADGESAVVDKVKEIYKNLDIDEEDGKENSFMESIENKLDEQNKDIEEIRDDAEAQEDDVKEEQENACENACEEACDNACEEAVEENAFEPHDKGEEGLEDDVDADKDYWKKKAQENEAQLAEVNRRLMALEREKEMADMDELLKEYAVCLEEEDMSMFRSKFQDMSCDKFSAELYAYIAKKAKEEKMSAFSAQQFSYMPSNVGMQINDSHITLEEMSNKYSKK